MCDILQGRHVLLLETLLSACTRFVLEASAACCLCVAAGALPLVSEEELEKQRAQFRNGQLDIKIEEQSFSMKCAPVRWHLSYCSPCPDTHSL